MQAFNLQGDIAFIIIFSSLIGSKSLGSLFSLPFSNFLLDPPITSLDHKVGFEPQELERG